MRPMNFGDGFRFGCGFFLATVVAYLILLAVGVVITIITGAGLASILPSIRP